MQKEVVAKLDPPLAALAPDSEPPTAAGSGPMAAAAVAAQQNATLQTDWRARLNRMQRFDNLFLVRCSLQCQAGLFQVCAVQLPFRSLHACTCLCSQLGHPTMVYRTVDYDLTRWQCAGHRRQVPGDPGARGAILFNAVRAIVPVVCHMCKRRAPHELDCSVHTALSAYSRCFPTANLMLSCRRRGRRRAARCCRCSRTSAATSGGSSGARCHSASCLCDSSTCLGKSWTW